MKPMPIRKRPLILGLCAAAFLTVLVSWDFQQSGTPRHTPRTDTIPKNKSSEVTNIDEAIEALDHAERSINFDEIRASVENALKEVNNKQFEADIEKAMASAKKALAEIDWEKIKTEVDEAVKSIDLEKIKKDLEKVNEKEMKKLQEEMKKVKEELKDMGPKMEQAMATAKKEMEKAKVEMAEAREKMKDYKTIVDGLHEAGLIDKNKEYNVEVKNGDLLIDGKKADAKVQQQYRSIIDKHKNFRIMKTSGSFNVTD